MQRIFGVLVLAALLAGCGAKTPPLAGPLVWEIHHHIEAEVFLEDVSGSFAENLTLRAALDLPASPSAGTRLRAPLLEWHLGEPLALSGLEFTVRGWNWLYPQLRPEIPEGKGGALELTFGDAGRISAAEIELPGGGAPLHERSLPEGAAALLLERTSPGTGRELEVERIVESLRDRWEQSFAPERFGRLLSRHLALPEPEGGWRVGAQCVLEDVLVGDYAFKGGLIYSVDRIEGGRAFLRIKGSLKQTAPGPRTLTPLGIVEASFEGAGTGWAWLDIPGSRILQQTFALDGEGEYALFMVKYRESLPFRFRLSVASGLEAAPAPAPAPGAAPPREAGATRKSGA